MRCPRCLPLNDHLAASGSDMTDARSAQPAVVLTSCDRITSEVRKALLGRIPLSFAESEAALQQLAASGAQLVVLHQKGSAADGGVAGRLVRAVPDLSASVVVLFESTGARTDCAPKSDILNDILFVKEERWLVLLQAWANQPINARQRTAELRVLAACAPVQLLHVFDLLMLAPESSLSVKKWSADTGVSRTQVYRELAPTGVRPTEVVDVVRAMHIVGPTLMEQPAPGLPCRRRSSTRTEHRVLARTFGMTKAEIMAVGEPGSPAVRQLVAERLRLYFERLPSHPWCALPASANFRT